MVVIGSAPYLKPDKRQPSREWLHSPNLLASIRTPTAKLVFLYIANRFLAGEEVIPWSADEGSANLGCSSKSIYLSLQWLVRNGFLVRAGSKFSRVLTIPESSPLSDIP